MTLSPELISLSALIRTAACVELLPRHGQLRASDIRQHSDGSLFTIADLANEEALVKGARLIYPGDIPTGEEQISENPHEFLKMALAHDVIIFDSIDGTGAFKRGEDTYGVMAARICKGVTTAAAIYTPGHALMNAEGALHPEKDLMILAEKGNGCFVNGRRVTLAGRASSLAGKARIAFACRNQDKEFESVLAEGVAGYVERNNSSHDYTRILTGACDATFYSEGFMPLTGLGKCPPWDHAAGILAIQESGGYAALPYAGEDGVPYTPLVCHDRLLVCASQTLFRDVIKHVQSRTPHLIAPRLSP